MCKHCRKAADLPEGTSQKARNKLHGKCIARGNRCTCQHKSQGSWKGVKL